MFSGRPRRRQVPFVKALSARRTAPHLLWLQLRPRQLPLRPLLLLLLPLRLLPLPLPPLKSPPWPVNKAEAGTGRTRADVSTAALCWRILGDCGFTQWLDEAFPEKATMHINNLLSREECLEQQVENLQEELNELRRRYVTGSSHRDGQDSETRPRQVRRMI
nr:uncharacterized protein LOC117840773 isoform X1 [Setaria viridis]